MLESLKLKEVGPALNMEMALAPRLNLITGDNGLGKSFLLDVAWWALTRTWAGTKVLPRPAPAVPEICSRYVRPSETIERIGRFVRADEEWHVLKDRLVETGLVLYAQADGGFSVADPVRNHPKKGAERTSTILFSAQEVWDGNVLCEGLIRDWASWQREENASYVQLKSVLGALSPSPSEPLDPGELRKVFLDDPKRYPTLRMPYGQEVPVIYAAAGMRRIIALAYLLVWAWQEHVEACRLVGQNPTSEIIFLVDEVEAHLHPQWQRRIVPAILHVMASITGTHAPDLQLVTTTHSPLVLASVETDFDPEIDAWFDLDLVTQEPWVVLTKRPFVRRGDVSNWLTSEAFDLKEARSLQAEEAITQALALTRMPSPAREDIERVNVLLQDSLGEIDRFWVRWSAFRESEEARK